MVLMLLVAGDHWDSPAFWVVFAVGVLTPHAQYLWASRAADVRRAERANVLLDFFWFGLVAALIAFRLLPTLAISVMALINGLLFGGLNFVVRGLAPLAAGAGLGIAWFGLHVRLEAEPAMTTLAVTAIVSYVSYIGLTAYRIRLRQRATRAALEEEERKSHRLLVNVFPAPIVERLKAGEGPIADQFADVTVVFADIVEFTPLAERLGPKRTVYLLNELFRKFDKAAEKLGVEKIETTGDGYLAVAGAPQAHDRHEEAGADFALALIDAASEPISDTHIEVRVGINTGPIFGGVVGESRFHYKIFGETVNTASRIQAQSQPGRILVSESTHKRLGTTHKLEERGLVELKGHGPMRTYWLIARNS